jgi:hypothetical protein
MSLQISSFPAPTPTFLGTSLLGLGLLRLLAPKPAYTLFGLPLPASGSPSPFIFANAGRDIALGLSALVLGGRGDGVGVRTLVCGTVVRIHFSNLRSDHLALYFVLCINELFRCNI